MRDTREDISWQSELKGTLWLAGPIVLGNLGQILIGVVDTLMIGRIGVVPLGAAAFVNNVFVVPLVTLMGILAAVTVLVSQSNGADDSRAVGRHIRHGLAMTLGLSLGACLLMAVNFRFLGFYGQSEDVVLASKTYYWLMCLSLIPALVYHFLKSVWEGVGCSQPPMLILMGGIGLNVLLNWILIFGKFGFPSWGLEGAGAATLISRLVVMGVMLAVTLRSKRFHALLPRRWWSGFEKSSFVRLLRLGLPMGAQHLFEVGAFAGAGIMVGWISKEALAAHQIAMSCAAMAFMVPLGISIACGIRVGEAFGGMSLSRIKRIYLSTLGFTFLQTTASAVFFLLGGSWLAGLFVHNDLVVSLASSIFVVVGLFQIFDGAQVVCMGALRGMSDVNIPMVITFLTYWVLALPAGYSFAFVFGLGSVGVWVGLACGLFVAAAALFVRLHRRSRLGSQTPAA
ncbi:MATE family efflux transporter [Pelagicoccus albus]|uniref:Multidrug-efflux transporter n=1 Tax=Pelagicoccus albus TaxID=415222 RepID=A0A7X1B8U9_9BACT|nr:MATE family efflux transporter [Pelagicoccus albus]MBC2606523.1 MATE family efflux transporter [Pelagicoccus albus]